NERAMELNIELKPNLKELITNADIIINATSAKFALSVAEEALPHLTSEDIYLDFNAGSPMDMEKISELFEGKTNFVDVAVVESIPKFKHQVPLLLSGKGAEKFRQIAIEIGMNVEVVSDDAGKSSAIKLIRSIFMKGFTMLLLETLSASEKYKIYDYILNSIENSITKTSLEETANLLITRTATHAERRVAEMSAVIDTLDGMNVNSKMSEATKEKLEDIVNSDIGQYFVDEEPKDYKEIIDKINNKN